MLFNASGTAVDSVNVPSLQNNMSYSRVDELNWEITANYTPGMANTKENHDSITDVTVESPIIVTEIMARNATYDVDGSGMYYDYVELYNSGAESVDISGYHLSDSRDDVMDWEFPGFSVDACKDELYALEKEIAERGFVQSMQHRFFLVARKPY